MRAMDTGLNPVQSPAGDCAPCSVELFGVSNSFFGVFDSKWSLLFCPIKVRFNELASLFDDLLTRSNAR